MNVENVESAIASRWDPQAMTDMVAREGDLREQVEEVFKAYSRSDGY